MRWSARLRGVPRNRGASRRPRAIRRLGRIKTPDAWVLRHVESKITARRMGGKRSPREPDLGDDRATQNVAEPGSPRGPAPGTAGTRGPTSRIPPQAALHPRVPVLRPVTPVSSGPGHPTARVPRFAPGRSPRLAQSRPNPRTSIGSTPRSDRPDARKQVGMISEPDRADRKHPPD